MNIIYENMKVGLKQTHIYFITLQFFYVMYMNYCLGFFLDFELTNNCQHIVKVMSCNVLGSILKFLI